MELNLPAMSVLIRQLWINGLAVGHRASWNDSSPPSIA